MSVPRSIHRIVTVPRARGMTAMTKKRKGDISGILLVRLYAMDFFKLSNIRRPDNRIIFSAKELKYLLDRTIKKSTAFSTFFHSSHNGGKVIIQENHVSSLFGDIRSSNTHSYTNVSLLQSRRIIDTIASHSHNGALLVQTYRCSNIDTALYCKHLNL